jgi:phosphate transport system protein
MPQGRREYSERLHELEEQALGALDLVGSAVDRVIAALDESDGELAELVVADDDRIDGRYLEVHQGILSLLATQAPVATDLRVAAALLHVIRHAERMGDQCVNIAKLIPLCGDGPPLPSEILDRVDRMAEVAQALVRQSQQAFRLRDVGIARDLVARDDELDILNREVFHLAIDAGDEPAARECAMYMMLVARSLERIGDNAVDIGEQVAFVVTGLFREFQDASHA